MVIGLTRPTSQAHGMPRESNYQKLLPSVTQIGFSYECSHFEARDKSFKWKFVIISVVICQGNSDDVDNHFTLPLPRSCQSPVRLQDRS